MAFPQVVQVTQGQSSGSVLTLDCNLPSSLTTDNLLLMFWWGSGTSGTWTAPTGWTDITKNQFNLPRNAMFYRKVDDTEGATATVTQGTSREMSYIVLEIGPWHGTTAPEISAVATGDSTAPDPSSLNPAGWDVEDTLWLAHILQDLDAADSGAVSAVPANYTLVGSAEIYAEQGMNCIAKRELAAASEDAGAFTTSPADSWRAYMMAIRPGSSGGAGSGTTIPIFSHHLRNNTGSGL